MRERKESYDGDGRERGDGDGGDRSKEKEVRQDQFVFGRTNSSGPSKVGAGKENEHSARRPISLSYKEKLLSPGNLGYLVTHAEEDDIVSGWRGYFSKRNEGETTANEDAEKEGQGNVDGRSASGYPILSVTSEQYTSWCRPWMNSLVIKLLGLSVPKHVLIDRVRRMWRPRQPLKVVPLSHEFYIVSFSSMEDRDYALYEGPWMIDDHYLLVQWWRPNFNPQKADCQRKIAVWVRIPDLPMEFCTVEALGIIGNMIGKMIKIDRSTSIYDKGEFARICVEVDLQQPLLPAFTALGEDKQLVYEGLHLVCFRCGLYGHDRRDCPQLNVADEVARSVNRDKGAGVDEVKGVPKQTMADGGGNGEVAKLSMEEGGRERSGHSKEKLVNTVKDGGGSKQNQWSPEEDGMNTVVGIGDGGAPMVGQDTVEMGKSGINESINEGAKMVHNDFGSSKHLGPQMILKHDLRRNSPISAKKPILKNSTPGSSLGIKKEGGNHGISRSGSIGLKKRDVGGADLMGSPNIPLNEKEKNKGEWVVVGSKRKKDERPKMFGKENKTGGRPKLKPKDEEPSSMEMNNGFAALHDLGPTNDNLVQSDMLMDDGQQCNSGQKATCGVVPSHDTHNAETTSSKSMGDGVMQQSEQDECHGNGINGVGSGLAPPNSSTSYQ
ncbi:hypothetical protein K1719_038918 [Acacia pycnantha]|nr:hypothetical protein K1719_038918 [Acacia pycnantha]